MKQAHSPAHAAGTKVVLNGRIGEHCFWMKWRICPCPCRTSFYGCWNTENSSGWAEAFLFGWMCGWWRRPTVTCPGWLRRESFVRICWIAWRLMSCMCRPCVNAGRTNCFWPGILPRVWLLNWIRGALSLGRVLNFSLVKRRCASWRNIPGPAMCVNCGMRWNAACFTRK